MNDNPLVSMINNSDEIRYEGESIYQGANGLLENLNPQMGVTLKELIVNKSGKEDSFGFVKIGLDLQNNDNKRMTRTQYNSLRSKVILGNLHK